MNDCENSNATRSTESSTIGTATIIIDGSRGDTRIVIEKMMIIELELELIVN